MDGTPNEAGRITEAVDLIVKYKDHTDRLTFHVMSVGQGTIILGHTWLAEHNPNINWCTGEVKMTYCPEYCGSTKVQDSPKAMLLSSPIRAQQDDLERVNSTSTVSMQLAEVAQDTSAPASLDKILPEPYHTF